MSNSSPSLPPFRVGASVYRRAAPMTIKGRVTAVWWSKQTSSWQVIAEFPDGDARLGADKLMEVPRNG